MAMLWLEQRSLGNIPSQAVIWVMVFSQVIYTIKHLQTACSTATH